VDDWKIKVFMEEKWCLKANIPVSRLGAIEQFFLIISYLGKIIYRVGTEEGTMTFYMKECVGI